MTDLISVIVTTYNRPDALDAALRALAHQSDQKFEIIVADDGSRPDTARVIESWTSTSRHRRSKHVWQKNQGFRGAEIRNRGIPAAAGDYCIFLDGDCLAPIGFCCTPSQSGGARMVCCRQPHPAFGETHQRLLAGSLIG